MSDDEIGIICGAISALTTAIGVMAVLYKKYCKKSDARAQQVAAEEGSFVPLSNASASAVNPTSSPQHPHDMSEIGVGTDGDDILFYQSMDLSA